jgi:hypothetical protein
MGKQILFRNVAEENLLSHIVLPSLRSFTFAGALPGRLPIPDPVDTSRFTST